MSFVGLKIGRSPSAALLISLREIPKSFFINLPIRDANILMHTNYTNNLVPAIGVGHKYSLASEFRDPASTPLRRLRPSTPSADQIFLPRPLWGRVKNLVPAIGVEPIS